MSVVKGELKVVGLGPGRFELLTGQAVAALEWCQTLVGYKRYLALLPSYLLEGRNCMATGMTKEIERCEQAIEAARSGSRTALVSSGDAGVYGMAGLVLELLAEKNLDQELDVEIIPGVPALMAAAALLGAPLMHDFACISLSDLLTPWERIEKRLECAAAADFVIGLYNPRSLKRTWQLPRTLEIIRTLQPAATPVGLVRQAFRQDERVSVHTLADFDPEAVDMLSICIVGNSTTRIVANRMVTPRGYFGKYRT